MSGEVTNRTAKRALRNEATFRGANEQIAERRDELGLDHEKTPFICECEEEGCQDLVKLDPREYMSVRAEANRFFMVTGHRTRGTVIAENDGWVIVEKDGLD